LRFEAWRYPAVEGEHTSAAYEHGLLTLTLPKIQHARSHSIKVTAGSGSQRALEQQAGQE